jgi:hypothetical protein
MPREEFDPENVIPYKNSAAQNLGANKEIQKRIDNTFKKHSESQFKKLGSQLVEKNTYFTASKIPSENKADQERQRKTVQDKFIQRDTNDDEYCQKCPSRKVYCPHREPRPQIKDKFCYPIQSSSTYGWLVPYDNLLKNYNLNQNTKYFYDHSHL